MAIPKFGNKGGSNSGKRGGGGKSFAGFEYRERNEDTARERATRRVGAGDSYLSDEVRFFQPREGDHEIRVLPPTWDNAEHLGLDIWLHYSIGPDQSSYLCPQKMKSEPCPLCEERARANQAGEKELAEDLQPKPRVAFYVIDRRAERDGPKLWSCPPTVEKEMMAQSVDNKTNSVISLDDPSDGYDVSFTVEGSREKTKYKAIKADRRPSPLSDNEDQAAEWLEFVKEHPVPDALVYYDYDHIAEALSGGVGRREDDEQRGGERGEDKDKSRGRKEERPERGAGKGGGRPRFDFGGKERSAGSRDDEYTWEEVHEMDESETDRLARKLRMADNEFEGCGSLEEVQDRICTFMDLAPPDEGKGDDDKGSGKGGGSVADRMAPCARTASELALCLLLDPGSTSVSSRRKGEAARTSRRSPRCNSCTRAARSSTACWAGAGR